MTPVMVCECLRDSKSLNSIRVVDQTGAKKVDRGSHGFLSLSVLQSSLGRQEMGSSCQEKNSCMTEIVSVILCPKIKNCCMTFGRCTVDRELPEMERSPSSFRIQRANGRTRRYKTLCLGHFAFIFPQWRDRKGDLVSAWLTVMKPVDNVELNQLVSAVNRQTSIPYNLEHLLCTYKSYKPFSLQAWKVLSVHACKKSGWNRLEYILNYL